MKCHSTSKWAPSASFVVAILFMVACNPSPTPVATAPASAATEVYVIFEGPWAFASDPKDANSIIAMAPKTKRHRDLFVQWWEKPLTSGVYELSVPPRAGAAAGTIGPNILRAKIDAATVQRVLDTKSDRYAVRLPKPDAYISAMQYRSRAGSTYPPDASTEKDYVSSISLRYSVTTLNGFSLAGTPDSGTMNPLLLPVDTPVINFVIAPGPGADPADKCNMHSRGSFGDLVKLLNLTLFIDFPNDPPECHAKDPQNTHPAKAANTLPTRWQRTAALFTENLADVQGADASLLWSETGPNLWKPFVGGPSQRLTSRSMAAVLYFFGLHPADCHAPMIVGDGS